MEKSNYDTDVVLWSQEQAALLRAGKLSQLDIEHLADEIEDVGKSEKRELASRMAVLLAHLLKWRHQPERRGRSWTTTIAGQRKAIAVALRQTPSLAAVLSNPDWNDGVWADATTQASLETGLALEVFGDACPWPVDAVLSSEFHPD